MPQLEWLQSFAVFAEHRNFTRAAQALHMSQPALHGQVRKLAAALGVPLYVREGRSLVLTPAGVRTASFARDVGGRVRVFESGIREEVQEQPVILAAGEGSLLYLLSPSIRRFVQGGEHRLRLLTRDAPGTLDAVRQRQAHLGVTSLDTLPDDLDSEFLAEVGPVALMPADHDLAGESVLGLDDLDGQRLILPPPGRPHRVAVESALAAVGCRWEVSVEATGWEPLRRFVEMGLGLAVVNGFCPPPPGCVAVALPELGRRRYYLLSSPDPVPHPGIRALQDVISAGMTEGTGG
jgi:LysR family transcriptional regulator, low CO2-responsive transcriptional regulator